MLLVMVNRSIYTIQYNKSNLKVLNADCLVSVNTIISNRIPNPQFFIQREEEKEKFNYVNMFSGLAYS